MIIAFIVETARTRPTVFALPFTHWSLRKSSTST
jgi:hypothetical protein